MKSTPAAGTGDKGGSEETNLPVIDSDSKREGDIQKEVRSRTEAGAGRFPASWKHCEGASWLTGQKSGVHAAGASSERLTAAEHSFVLTC